MKRRGFLGTVAGGMAGGAVVATGISKGAGESTAAAAPGPLMTTPAVHMAPRADGLEVVWAVSRLACGWVEWKGADGSSGKAHEDAFGFVPQGDRVVRVRVEGLTPGGKYQLRAVTESGDAAKIREESPWKDFTPLDPKAATTKFVVWNDTHEHNDTIQKLHAATPQADFLMWNGDTCNNWITEELLAPTLLHPGGQDVSTGRPMFIVWGNHDVRGKWAFKMPDMIPTPDGRPYYAFRSGPVAFICLHTGEDKPDDHPSFGGRVAFEQLRAQQAEWIKKVIVRPEFKDAPYRVVFCHIPLRWHKEEPKDYANGGYDDYSKFSRDAWHDSLVEWKTQLVISGHTHQHAWFPGTEQFPYAQLVGGGPQMERATFMEAAADATAFKLAMKDLDGKVLQELTFKPVV